MAPGNASRGLFSCPFANPLVNLDGAPARVPAFEGDQAVSILLIMLLKWRA
jgi:hypothetical protein